jgi:16S rRNA processing protein RimM|tara:strand:+ start:35 stop:547 length:513 start_codon:yes stop_codon:yes gene_type:complete
MNFSYTKIGTIITKHGFNGSLILKVSGKYSNNLSIVDFLFIEINKKHIPFKLDSIKTFKNKSYKIKFNEVNDDAYANQLISKSVFIKSNDYPDLKKETNIYSAIMNFSAFNNEAKIGEIININENLPQPVFEINYKSKTVMVPIHEDLIIKIDKENKNIFLRIPDGLLDI